MKSPQPSLNRFALLCSVCFLLFSVHPLQAQLGRIDLGKGLQAWYAFQHSLESKVASAPPSLAKGAAWTSNRFGESDGAIAFGGVDQHILIPTEGMELTNGTHFSLSLWMQSLDDNSGCILLKEGAFGLKWNGLKKALTVYHAASGSFLTATTNKWTSTDWYHLLLIADGKEIALYINGQLDTKWEVDLQFEVESKSTYLGYHPYFWGAFMGKIDDVGIYNRALNQAEIQTLGQLANIPLETAASSPTKPLVLEDFMGTWQGVVIQPGNDMVENYPFWFHLNKKGAVSLNGFTRIEIADENAYGVTKAQAYISGNTLNFEENQVLRQKNYLGYRWCKKYGSFQYDEKDGSLRGKWYSDNCSLGGEVILYRTDNKFNYHDNRLSKPVSIEELVKKLTKEGETDKVKDELLQLQLDPILFVTSSSNLTGGSISYLKETLVSLLIKYPSLKLSISGFTDSV
ncbi:MAG: LamG-like jellyroll fold domain-containing protein, partial [Bacteroidota bacterium]